MQGAATGNLVSPFAKAAERRFQSAVVLLMTGGMTRLCILTPDPAYDENWQPDAERFRGLFGDALTFRPWDDAGDLSQFDLILPLLAWGYQRQAARWYKTLDGWRAAGWRFANDLETLCWNTDKDYLLDLQAASIAIVPSVEVHGLTPEALAAARADFGCDTLVVKPSISGGADGTYRLGPDDRIPFDVIEREMLIQPMMESIMTEGEYSLFAFGGTFSHAILKKPAAGDFRVQEQFGGRDVSIVAPAPALMLGMAALAACPAMPLYARVDMIRDARGAFALMELELIEPSLFLGHASDGGALFMRAVSALITESAR
jgi:hypothetical protein